MNHVKTILHMSIWDKSKQTLYCSPNIYIAFWFLQFISVQTSLDFSIIKFDQNVVYELRKKFFEKKSWQWLWFYGEAIDSYLEHLTFDNY